MLLCFRQVNVLLSSLKTFSDFFGEAVPRCTACNVVCRADTRQRWGWGTPNYRTVVCAAPSGDFRRSGVERVYRGAPQSPETYQRINKVYKAVKYTRPTPHAVASLNSKRPQP